MKKRKTENRKTESGIRKTGSGNRSVRNRMEKAVRSLMPAGLDCGKEIRMLYLGILAGVLYSTRFCLIYYSCYKDLFVSAGGKRILLNHAEMQGFDVMIRGAMAGFSLMILCLLAVMLYHYLYHFQGSRSIYTMRRLPDRWELLKRCVAVPLMGIAVCLVLALLLLGIYYVTYLVITPQQYLAPLQLQKLWSAWAVF